MPVLSASRNAAARRTRQPIGSAPHIVEKVQRIQAVCDAHGVPMLSAALQFVLAHPRVVSVIPGSQSVAEHSQNVAALDVSIPAAFWAELKARELLHPRAPVPAA
jgi:D-threo-aldose 1-dehydrogenase